MKNFSLLALLLAIGVFVFGPSESMAQPCTPAHVTYSIAKNPNTSKLEVSITSDKSYTPAVVGQSVIVGITFPTGYAWTGGAASFLNLNGNLGNGSWDVLGLTIAPSCSPTKDYLLFNLSNLWVTTLTAGQPRVILSFDLPQVPAPCNGSVFMLENNDPFATSGGCSGNFSIANYIAVAPGEGFVCDNYAGNTNNTGITCDFSAPLPVELIDFTVRAKGTTSVLSWSTASERNSAGFEAQRSTDGVKWEKIGWTKGQGNSDELFRYELIDRSPAKGLNYYRLKLVDLDGASEFTEVRSLRFGSDSGRASIYPNPSNGALTLELPSGANGDVDLKVMDAKGTVVHTQTIKEGNSLKHPLDFTFLPAAAYTVQATYAGGTEHFPIVLVKR